MNDERVITNVFKPRWYVEQMKGWSFSSYMLLMFGVGFIISQTLADPLTAVTLWTMLAAVLGFTTTLSITNAKPLNGLFGLVSAIIYIVVALEAGNPSDAVLQGVYIVLLDLPVLLIPGWSGDVSKKVRKISAVHDRGEKPGFYKTYWFFAIVFVISYIALYWFDVHVMNSPRPLIDAGTAAIGITGAALTTLRFSESYYMWFLQGIAQIVLWGTTAMQGDASLVLFFTYMLYLSNDFIGFFDSPWFRKQTNE